MDIKVKLRVAALIIFAIILLCAPGAVQAQGPPPALVVASPAESGKIAEHADFVGTVYFSVVSDVASEVSGKVEKVNYEEGDSVKEGDVLVRLSSDLLEKSIASMEASHAEAVAGLTRAQLELERIEPLYKQQLASGRAYDDARLQAAALKSRAASMEAELERLKVELGKKNIRAPFDGVALTRPVDRGEWVVSGGLVARIAASGEMDIVVNVPQGMLPFVKPGTAAEVTAGGRTFSGKVASVVPSGDISTRTFPVKVRVRNDGSFAGGMDARVSLPSSARVDAVIVPRDAITSKFGATVVFAAVDGMAKMIPVKVIGYSGTTAGVMGEGLKGGMLVVVKGNERLNDGQPVNVAEPKK